MVAKELWPGKLTLSPIQPSCLFHPSHQSLLPPSSHESISDRMHMYMHTPTQAHTRMHATCTCTDTPVPTHAHTRMHATCTCTHTSTSHMITDMPHAHIHLGCAVRPACCEQLQSFLLTKANICKSNGTVNNKNGSGRSVVHRLGRSLCVAISLSHTPTPSSHSSPHTYSIDSHDAGIRSPTATSIRPPLPPT